MNIFQKIILFISFLLTSFIGFEDGSQGEEGNETESAIDKALSNLDTVIKSKTSSEIKDLVKNPETRDMILKAIDEEEEGEEEEAMKKKKKKEMKKSFDGVESQIDSTIEDNDSVIDAVPVLGEIFTCMQNMVKSFQDLETKVNDTIEKSENIAEVSKAIAAVSKEQSEILKSIQENIEFVSEEAGEIPGMSTQDAGTEISKSAIDSATDLFKSVQELGNNTIKATCVKLVKSKKVSMGNFSKYEQDGCNLKHFSATELQNIKKEATGGTN